MSWHTGSLVSVRESFVLAALRKAEPFVRLCERFQIARSTGYKWCRRFCRQGKPGLRDQSRKPRRSPRLMALRWQQALRQLRRRRPTWGPRKLHARLQRLHPRQRLPVPRTFGRWLRRLQLVPRRPRHQQRGPQRSAPRRLVARRPNDVWTIDFKGWFCTRDATRVEPLTVRDLTSRFILEIRLLPNQSDTLTRRALTAVFRRYGLPKAIRVDNGPPFGGCGPRGLSRLSVWWRRLGIRVEFGRPAHPQDNAAHEQMHGVYQAEIAAHPATHPGAQQRQSNRWRADYNQLRPHEALRLRVPALVYRPSTRALPEILPAWSYPANYSCRRIAADGRLFWQGRQRFIGRGFGNEIIGLQQHRRGIWKVFLGRDLLGLLHQNDRSKSLRPIQLIRPTR
jgi:putative transposase